MELMSSFLLCVLVALLPQTFGDTLGYLHVNANGASGSNEVQPSSIPRKTMQLIDIENVFYDLSCADCISCMERAIKSHTPFTGKIPNSKELRLDVPKEKVEHRYKRDTQTTGKSVKKVKNKKNKGKTLTVTKYNGVNGQIYALKVKETTIVADLTVGEVQQPTTTCQIYSVKKSHSCESVEGEALITAAKRKANKKMKKEQKENTDKSTNKTPTTQLSSSRKREADNSYVPETFMLSIEDIY